MLSLIEDKLSEVLSYLENVIENRRAGQAITDKDGKTVGYGDLYSITDSQVGY